MWDHCEVTILFYDDLDSVDIISANAGCHYSEAEAEVVEKHFHPRAVKRRCASWHGYKLWLAW
jgi:hypothetical protein